MTAFPEQLRGRRILVGVTGGIAAYKAVELCRLLMKAGAEVKVVMTSSAQEFVGANTFAAITHNPVATNVFADAHEVPHVKLARWADLVCVAPSTANLLASVAAGRADDLLTNVLLMARCPVVLVAAMHTEMWEHAATQANVATIRSRPGVSVLDPEAGDLAGGDTGVGRMLEPIDIRDAVVSHLQRVGDMQGVSLLVTAAGTREPIDPVRFIGNKSSGRMGYAIAADAAERGANVTLVSGPSNLESPPGVNLIRVQTAAEMATAVTSDLDSYDAVVKTAAVADFKPVRADASKIKKTQGVPSLELEPTVDILATLGAMDERPLLVGFAAETDDHLANARKKLLAKGADMLVMNDVSRADIGFDSQDNEVWILDTEGSEEHLGLRSKLAIANAINDRIVKSLKARPRKDKS